MAMIFFAFSVEDYGGFLLIRAGLSLLDTLWIVAMIATVLFVIVATRGVSPAAVGVGAYRER